MRLPRDDNANNLVRALMAYGYGVIRQTVLHNRLSKIKGTHLITVPNHNPIKLGTLNSIIKDVCTVNNIDVSLF